MISLLLSIVSHGLVLALGVWAGSSDPRLGVVARKALGGAWGAIVGVARPKARGLLALPSAPVNTAMVWAIGGALAVILAIGAAWWAGGQGARAKGKVQEARERVEIAERETRRDTAIADIGAHVTIEREQIRVESELGRREIEQATPEIDPEIDAGLVAAWRGALERLQLYPEAGSLSAQSS